MSIVHLRVMIRFVKSAYVHLFYLSTSGFVNLSTFK